MDERILQANVSGDLNGAILVWCPVAEARNPGRCISKPVVYTDDIVNMQHLVTMLTKHLDEFHTQ